MLRYLRSLPSSSSRPALFLDRDGVLNRRIVGGYVLKPEQLVLLEVALEAARWAGRQGAALVVVTNQGAIARGLATEGEIAAVHASLIDALDKRGVVLDGIYACPHHPAGRAPHAGDCRCRKPEPGLILQAARDLNLDLERSILIGDQPSDVQAAHAAGITGPRAMLIDADQADLVARTRSLASTLGWSHFPAATRTSATS